LLFGFFAGYYLKIMPLPGDPNHNWYSPFDQENPFIGNDREIMDALMPSYTSAVKLGIESGDWTEADKMVEFIDDYQRVEAHPSTLPSKFDIELEIVYN